MARNRATNQVASRPPVRILIAEDSPADAELSAATLVKAGYRLTFDIANTPGDFRLKVRGKDYDIILADFNLGSWTAIDALEILSETRKDIPLIVVTGSLGDEAAVDCIKRGAADYVLKSRLDRLPMAFGRVLREKVQREEAARLQRLIWRAKHDWERTFDTVSDPILILDGDCRIQRANRALAEMASLSFPDLIGRYCHEVLHGTAEPRRDCPHQIMLLADQSGLTWPSRISGGSSKPQPLRFATIPQSRWVVCSYFGTYPSASEGRRSCEKPMKLCEPWFRLHHWASLCSILPET